MLSGTGWDFGVSRAGLEVGLSDPCESFQIRRIPWLSGFLADRLLGHVEALATNICVGETPNLIFD